MLRASDLRLSGPEFDPQPPHYRSFGTGMGDRLWAGISPRYVISHVGQLSLLPPVWTGNEYQPKCGDVLRLGVMAGWLFPFADKRVGGR